MAHEFPPSIYSGVPSSLDDRYKRKPASMLAVVRFHRKAAALNRWLRKQRLDGRGLDAAIIYPDAEHWRSKK